MLECNLLEIASDGDKARAQRRAALIDSLKPVRMMERLDIQKCEDVSAPPPPSA